MKKLTPFLTGLITTLCFVFFANGLTHAQKYTYKPLALEGAHWRVGFTDTNFPPFEPTDYYMYVVRGDTTLNDMEYKKVYYRELTNQNPYLIEYEILAGWVRDDSLNKRVYANLQNIPYPWFCPINVETIIYDFNLNVGDTMNSCLIHSGPGIIQSIDFEFIYGEERRTLSLFSEKFIEGIGSEFGVFEWGLGSKTNEKGWWFTLEDYCLGTDEECDCLWVDIEEREEITTFKIYPNPLTGNAITLIPQIPITQPLVVKLLDITGREFYQQHFENLTKEVKIQIPTNLISGTSPLLLWVGSNKQVFFKQIIIKQ